MVAGHLPCPSNVDTLVLAATTTGSATAGLAGRSLTLYNPSAQGIYIGGDTNLDSSNGFLLAVGSAPITLQLGPGDAVYARGVTSTPTLQFLSTEA
jgi:hypothetical protein